MLKEEQALVDRLEESMMGIALREGADDRLRRLAMGGLIAKCEYSKYIWPMFHNLVIFKGVKINHV